MGPLADVRLIEFASLGPGPFCAMMLSDLGADIVRVDRPGTPDMSSKAAALDPMNRGRRSIAVNLKHPDAPVLILDLIATSDGIIEGFRPGVMERLGLGPEDCLARNPSLVYGRVTGWGQDGPYAQAAGHDLNYIALAGVLDPVGQRGSSPVPPLNFLGDFGGGGMLLAVGMLAALHEARCSGLGQVIDASMVEGASLLATMIHGLRAAGEWNDERGTNFNDTGAHFYNVYATRDSSYLSIAAIEPKFYDLLLDHMGLADVELPDQYDQEHWPAMIDRFAEVFAQHTLAEWCERLEGTDVCFAPVLKLGDAPDHAQNRFRQSFVEVAGVMQPAPAPRLSRTPPTVQGPPPRPGQHTASLLKDLGFDAATIAGFSDSGLVG
jgi:alpha-methylacyl-CoA racemase